MTETAILTQIFFNSCPIVLSQKKMKRRLRNEGVVNEDRISHLPEALLLHILSLIPINDVVATSVLSKQWRSLWKMVPKLKFDYVFNKRKHETFTVIVSKLLVSNTAPVLESLHVYFSSDRCDAMDIGMWVGAAYARRVRKLVLNVKSKKGPIKFPRSLYNCETLVTLKLIGWVLVDLPSQVCMRSLRTLHLHGVDYKDDASVLNLLSGCPNLENLRVYRLISDVKIFTIAVPSLQRLEINDDSDVQEFEQGYVINTPSLKYLKISGFKALNFCLIENAPELVEANISNVSKIIDEKPLVPVALTSVKRLSLALSPLEIRFPTRCTFNQLVYLKLYTHKDEWWNLLLLMLDRSPKLQVLKLIGVWLCAKNCLAGCEKWNQQKKVCKRLLLHLETFVWNGYKEQLEDEKEVAKYILRNANRLQKATFSIKGLNSDERLKLLQELKSVARASNSPCQLLMLE